MITDSRGVEAQPGMLLMGKYGSEKILVSPCQFGFLARYNNDVDCTRMMVVMSRDIHEGTLWVLAPKPAPTPDAKQEESK